MFAKIFVCFVFIVLNGHTYAAILTETPPQLDTVKGRRIMVDCVKGYSLTCFKLDVIQFLDKYSTKQEIDIFPGISLVRDLNSSDVKNEEIISEMARHFPTDSEKRLDGFLSTKLTNFLESHTIHLNFLDIKPIEEACFVFTGRKGKFGGKKYGFLGIIAAVVMIKGILLGALAIGGVALLAGKALISALLALKLSTILGIKSLTGGHKQTTYEIITKPVFSQSNTHSSSLENVHGGVGGGHGGYGYSGYDRSFTFQLPEHLKTI